MLSLSDLIAQNSKLLSRQIYSPKTLSKLKFSYSSLKEKIIIKKRNSLKLVFISLPWLWHLVWLSVCPLGLVALISPAFSLSPFQCIYDNSTASPLVIPHPVSRFLLPLPVALFPLQPTVSSRLQKWVYSSFALQCTWSCFLSLSSLNILLIVCSSFFLNNSTWNPFIRYTRVRYSRTKRYPRRSRASGKQAS